MVPAGATVPDHARLFPTLGLYVHVPFCARKCLYCDFPSFAGMDALMGPYVDALHAEIDRAPTGRVHSLFFGGGTPSYLPRPLMKGLMAHLQEHFELAPDAEVTLETNPGNEGLHAVAGEEAFAAYLAMGITRLSIGVQSFDAAMLQKLGRIHGPDDAREAVRAARAAGFREVSIDLMYGLPGQSLETWAATLDEAIALDLPHLSAYSLIVEPDTPYEALHRRGRLRLPTEEAEQAMATLAQAKLGAAGYAQYEVSNWARPGAHSRHNATYWRNEPWVGLGSGAHGYVGRRRTANPAAIADYVAGHPATDEPQTLAAEIEETLFMGLRRTDEGVSDARFRARFGVGLADVYGPVLHDLAARGLVSWDGERVVLTSAGLPLANEAFAAFLLDG